MGKIREYIRELCNLSRLQAKLASQMPSSAECRDLLKRFRTISKSVSCPHNDSHILSFVTELLALPKDLEGCVVEAGCFKGGSTAKFSLVAKKLNRSFAVFDSFEGLPDNKEAHDRSIFDYSIEGWFQEGEFCGSLGEVVDNVREYGQIDVCKFIKGWFEDTMPDFTEKICAAYIDVDLASSTKTCLKYLYPQIVPGGVLISQDGDFPLVIEVFDDDEFWETEVGCPKPVIEGLGQSKMLRIVKRNE